MVDPASAGNDAGRYAFCVLLTGAGTALLAGSLIEYWLHRALHARFFRGSRLWKVHLAHHHSGHAQVWWREGIDYCLVAFCGLPLGLPGAWLFGGWYLAGWALGSVAYAFSAGAAHAWQHADGLDNAHTLHHERPTKNFGLTSPLWDNVFGTRAGDDNHNPTTKGPP